MEISGVALPICRSSARDFVGDELAVGEDLEIAVRMRREQIEQLRVHERLAAEDAEERVPVRLRVGDRAVQRLEIDLSRGASTSTQQPWQRRLQELRIER